MASSSKNEQPKIFRPMRRGQVIEEVKTDQAQLSDHSVTRQKNQSSTQSSIFPNWDLLPPTTIIRRKGL